MITYAKVNGGLAALYKDLAAHSLSYDFKQLLVYAIFMAGPYLFIAISSIASKSIVSDAITFAGGVGMVIFTFMFFAAPPSSPSFKWAVVMLPVILFPSAFITFILSLIFDTKTRHVANKP